MIIFAAIISYDSPVADTEVREIARGLGLPFVQASENYPPPADKTWANAYSLLIYSDAAGEMNEATRRDIIGQQEREKNGKYIYYLSRLDPAYPYPQPPAVLYRFRARVALAVRLTPYGKTMRIIRTGEVEAVYEERKMDNGAQWGRVGKDEWVLFTPERVERLP